MSTLLNYWKIKGFLSVPEHCLEHLKSLFSTAYSMKGLCCELKDDRILEGSDKEKVKEKVKARKFFQGFCFVSKHMT